MLADIGLNPDTIGITDRTSNQLLGHVKLTLIKNPRWIQPAAFSRAAARQPMSSR